MSLVHAQFLVNNVTGFEQFVVNLPDSYEYGPNESLHEREITQEQYDHLLLNKDEHLKIFRYTSQLTGYDLRMPPKGLDYKIGLNGRLFTNPLVREDGFLTRMEYYGSGVLDPVTGVWAFSDIILAADFDYTIHPATKFVVSRVKTITWYKENDTAHPDKKVMFKNYSAVEMDDEAVERRKNVIALIKLEVAVFLAQLLALQYPNPGARPDSNEVAKAALAPLGMYVLNYINGGGADGLKAALAANPQSFWDTVMPKFGKTIRHFVIDRLS
jgi:hypothetical protein